MALRLHETVIHTMPALPKTIAIDSAVANVCCLRGYAFPLSCIVCGMSGLFVPAIDSKQCRKSKTGVPGSRRACISDPRHHVGNPTCMSQASRSDQNAKSTWSICTTRLLTPFQQNEHLDAPWTSPDQAMLYSFFPFKEIEIWYDHTSTLPPFLPFSDPGRGSASDPNICSYNQRVQTLADTCSSVSLLCLSSSPVRCLQFSSFSNVRSLRLVHPITGIEI